MITIVDYGMGNLASVRKALTRLGYDSRLTSDPGEVTSAERLILPGVGAFGAAMANLQHLHLVDPIRAYCASGRPFLGICLGMQLLMTESQELGSWDGLNIIPGTVYKFFTGTRTPLDIKVPHIGWNSLEIRGADGLLAGLPDLASVYFVHSYYAVPPFEAVAASCTHGETFCAALSVQNVHATQFHPEKSGAVGLRILRNFCEMTST